MKLVLREYSVVPNPEERNEVSIVLSDNKLLFNNEEQDVNKIELINNLLNENKESIINLKNENVQNSKGGRQKAISVQYDDSDETYIVVGNTPSEVSSNLYNTLKEKLLNIIEN